MCIQGHGILGLKVSSFINVRVILMQRFIPERHEISVASSFWTFLSPSKWIILEREIPRVLTSARIFSLLFWQKLQEKETGNLWQTLSPLVKTETGSELDNSAAHITMTIVLQSTSFVCCARQAWTINIWGVSGCLIQRHRWWTLWAVLVWAEIYNLYRTFVETWISSN